MHTFAQGMGLYASHWTRSAECKNPLRPDGELLCTIITENRAANLSLLETMEQCDAFTQMDCLHSPTRDGQTIRHYWHTSVLPQVSDLSTLRRQYPGSRFILNVRPAVRWVASMRDWNAMDMRLARTTVERSPNDHLSSISNDNDGSSMSEPYAAQLPPLIDAQHENRTLDGLVVLRYRARHHEHVLHEFFNDRDSLFIACIDNMDTADAVRLYTFLAPIIPCQRPMATSVPVLGKNNAHSNKDAHSGTNEMRAAYAGFDKLCNYQKVDLNR